MPKEKQTTQTHTKPTPTPLSEEAIKKADLLLKKPAPKSKKKKLKKPAPDVVLKSPATPEPIKNPKGRPIKYTKKLADELCSLLAEGLSMRSACRNENMPCMSTVFTWLRTRKDFLEQYEKSKIEAADAMAEDILDIADEDEYDEMEVERADGSTYTKANTEYMQRSRLRVETRKWLMSKMKPKKYGDKLEVDATSKGQAIAGIIINMPKSRDGKQKTSSN
jgi:hypothetical protein